MKLPPFLLFLALAFSAQAQLPFKVFHKDDVIVFQGDSITDGGRARTGNDYNHTMGQDYAYIVSALVGAQYSDRNLTFINRGIGGNKVTDLASRWQTDTLDLKPNLLSILIGVNDTYWGGGETVEQFEQTYDKLLADTLAVLPKVKIILCEPFVVAAGKRKDNYQSERAAIKPRQDIVSKLAEKYHLPIIRFQEVFDAANLKAPPEHWSWDGVHPTYAGHGLMAQEWMRVVNTLP